MIRGIVAAILLVASGIGSANAQSLSRLSQNVAALGIYRNSAVRDAEVAQDVCGTRRCGHHFQFYSMLYNRTATAFNSLNESMINQTVRHSRYKNSLYFNYAIKEAATQFSLLQVSFKKLVAGREERDDHAGSYDLNRQIDAAEEQIGKLFNDVVMAYRRTPRGERRQIIFMLDELKWRAHTSGSAALPVQRAAY